ncbi:hypothetical protein V8B97DRAFT_1989977 [Scleroderma yunnanense]
MSSSTQKTVAISLPLGLASDYDRTMFPVLRVKGAKEKGNLYLEATLEEMIRIREMAKYKSGYDHLLQNSKLQYDELRKRQVKIQNQRASFNPFKIFANQRQIRLFLEAGKVLYLATKKTSDEMRRDLLSYDSTNVAVPEGSDVSPDDAISGIAITLDSDIDHEIRSFLMDTASILTFTDPFSDPPDPTAFDDYATLSTEALITPEAASTPVGSGTRSPSGRILNIFNINNLHHSSSTVSGIDVSSPTGSVVIQAGTSEGDGSRIQSFDGSTSAPST